MLARTLLHLFPPLCCNPPAMMTRDEYDERKRLIDEQHRATIELIEAGRQAQLRALDLVWLSGGDGGVPLLPRVEGQAPGRPVRMLPSGASSEDAPRDPEPAPAPAKRRGVYELLEKIEAVLPSLPEVFDYHDLRRALGVELDRAAMRRNLLLLVGEEILAKEGTTRGRFRLLYRKLSPGVPSADG